MAANRLKCILQHAAVLRSRQMSYVHLEKDLMVITSRKCSSALDRTLTSKTVHANGIDFHYDEAGHGKHTVLLIPGALGCTKTDFLPQLTGLSVEKYRIIALDPRGYGQSRPPERDWPPLFYQRDADDVAAFMKALQIPRYSVLGWSDGAIVALIHSAACPGNVQRLVIWGANAYISAADIELFKNVTDISKWSEKMRQPFIELYGEDHFRKLWEGWGKAMQYYYTHRNGDLCIGSLPNIKCPTLIVNGVKDNMVAPEHAPFLQKHIPNCRKVDWPEGKHNLHLRYHREFNALVEQFLDEEQPLKHKD